MYFEMSPNNKFIPIAPNIHTELLCSYDNTPERTTIDNMENSIILDVDLFLEILLYLSVHINLSIASCRS
jgi:hypothetical protein